MSKYLLEWPIIELFVLSIVIFLYSRAWHGANSKEESVEERSLGATAVLTQLGAIITSSAIILGLLGAIVASLPEKLKGDAFARHNIIFAGIFAVSAVILALWGLGVTVGKVSTDNVTKRSSIAFTCIISMLFVGFSMIRFFVAFFTSLIST